jgi:hypothetical protein
VSYQLFNRFNPNYRMMSSEFEAFLLVIEKLGALSVLGEYV